MNRLLRIRMAGGVRRKVNALLDPISCVATTQLKLDADHLLVGVAQSLSKTVDLMLLSQPVNKDN